VPATWGTPGTVFTTQACRTARITEVVVGNIVDKGDHKEVQITITADCAQRRVVTYLAYPNGELRASDVAGTPTRKVCIPRLSTPTSERAGC